MAYRSGSSKHQNSTQLLFLRSIPHLLRGDSLVPEALLLLPDLALHLASFCVTVLFKKNDVAIILCSITI
jgi:hypothetical protein